jgi:hypothetical protein
MRAFFCPAFFCPAPETKLKAFRVFRVSRAPRRLRLFINCIYGSAIGVRSKERINRTRMTLMTLIIADKTLKDQRQSASSVFYEPVH